MTRQDYLEFVNERMEKDKNKGGSFTMGCALYDFCSGWSGTLGKGEVEFGKTYDSEYDYWDWELDGKYGIVDVYGSVFNNCYLYD